MKFEKLTLITALSLSFAAFSAQAAEQKAATGPTDPQIAAIVVAANSVDVDAGKVAKAKTKNTEVKKFAEQMITDHNAVNKSAVELVTKLKVTPEENDTSKALKDGGKQNLASLKKLKGKDFDKAYVGHEVDYHQQVLDAIDKTLIPSAKNAELKALLEKVRPAIAAHLEHAKHLQSTLQ
jgi:putative membrane protein